MQGNILDIITIAISVIALISSAIIGRKQVQISKQQADAQNTSGTTERWSM